MILACNAMMAVISCGMLMARFSMVLWHETDTGVRDLCRVYRVLMASVMPLVHAGTAGAGDVVDGPPSIVCSAATSVPLG